MSAVSRGVALCVPGNHDMKLMRKLRGREVQITHGLAESLAQLANEPEDFRKRVAEFIDEPCESLCPRPWQAGCGPRGHERDDAGGGSWFCEVRDFALYGETTGETDEFGLPVRFNWAAEYRGVAEVVVRTHACA